MRITIEEGGRAAEVLDISTSTTDGFRVALQEGDVEFLYVVPLATQVEDLVNRWLTFPDFQFGPLNFRATATEPHQLSDRAPKR